MGQVPEPGYALFSISPHSVRRSLIAWGTFAIVLFILAAIITWIVVGVKHAPIDDAHTMRVEFLFPAADLRPAGASVLDNTYDQPRLTKLGTYTEAEYREERGKATLILWYPPGVSGKVLISHLAGPDACQEVLSAGLPTERLTTEAIPPTDPSFSDDWILTVVPLRPHNPLVYDPSARTWSMMPNEYQAHIRCDLRGPADRETFVTKRVLVVARNATGLGTYMGGQNYIAVPMLYVRFPHVAGSESIEFSGGYSWVGFSSVESPESQRGIKLGNTVEVRWREADREGERDELLVVVGALIALGAAMMVEAVRPAVDRYIETHTAKPEATV